MRNRCGTKSHSWVDEARRVLRAVDLRAFGDLLDKNWRLKVSLTAGKSFSSIEPCGHHLRRVTHSVDRGRSPGD